MENDKMDDSGKTGAEEEYHGGIAPLRAIVDEDGFTWQDDQVNIAYVLNEKREELKRHLIDSISDLAGKFAMETGLQVSGIEVNVLSMNEIGRKGTVTYDVSVSVKL